MKRGTGAHTQPMNWFFHDLHGKTRDKENSVNLSSSSRICSDCYKAWMRYVTAPKRSSTGTGTAAHTGPNALFVQEKIKEVYVQEAEAHVVGSTSDSDAYVRLSREKVLAEFRQRILSECLYACEPCTKDELRAMLECMR